MSNEYKPSFLEKWVYNQICYIKSKSIKYKKHIPWMLIFGAFLAGFVFSIPLVMIDMSYSHIQMKPFSDIWIEKWGYIAFASILASMIELYVVFKLGVYMIYTLINKYGYSLDELSDSYILGFDFVLARLVVGAEEPKIVFDGIDAYKNQNKYKKIAKKLLYKIRITMTNAITKLIIRRFFIQNGLRIQIEWVSAFVIGFWNAFALYLIYLKAEDILNDMKKTDEYFEKLKKINLTKDEIEIMYRIVANCFVAAEHNMPTLQYIYSKLKNLYPIDNLEKLDLDSFDKLKEQIEKTDNKTYKDFYLFCKKVTEIPDKKLKELNYLLK